VTIRTLIRHGRPEPIEADDNAMLLDVVQDVLEAHAASKGCLDGRCGACRVLVDGRATNSCQVRWRDVPEGAELSTYEDVSKDPMVVAAVRAFEDERPTRCSLCVGGLGVTASALARMGQNAGPDAIEETLASATCMCTGRGSLRRALLVAIGTRRSGDGA
jgi:carbon-monoxide dehydrogenase small subunit